MAMKGFYFSFDALLALTVMAASLFVVSQSSDISSDSFRAGSEGFRQSTTVSQDSMKLASRQSYNAFNDSFRNKLVDKTVMEESDLNRTILDGIGLLWAARNISYAGHVSRNYFDRKVPDRFEYRLQVNEDGSRKIIYETSDPGDAEYISSISRLVSGHQVDRPSEGFQARARATSITKNKTEIFSIPAMGNAHKNGKMEVIKKFNITGADKIWNGTFFINVEYNSGESVEQFKINGVQKKNDLKILHDNGDTLYAKVDISDELEKGENTIFIRIKGKGSQTEPNEFQPGTMVRVKYRQDDRRSVRSKKRHERVYFENISARTQGSDEPGIFKVESFKLPEGAEIINASVHLNANGLDSGDCGYSDLYDTYNWDVKTIFNGETLEETCASGTYRKEYVLDNSDVNEGSNIFTVYLENYGNDFWGGDRAGIYSDFETNQSSHIDYWYNVSEDDLRFGEIEVTTSEQMGGGIEEPKIYEKNFGYDDLTRTEVYVAQKYSNTVHLEVDDGTGYEEVFQSPGVRASPTRITAADKFYNTDNLNKVKLYDSGPSVIEFYPESTFQWTVWAPSQVGYGQLYANRSDAIDDAEERLKNKLGPFVDATGIDTGTVSTGNQPYLWGPASIRLVVWRE